MAQSPQTKNERRNKMKKIMFNDRFGLTDAVLQGRKTMTRSIIPQLMSDKDFDISEWEINDQGKAYICLYEGGRPTTDIFPAYQPGEVVAVAQSYKSIHEEMMNGDYGNSRYDAFRCAMVAGTKGWNNKMFVKADLMPHQIRIIDIKVERLQIISDEDCLQEGVTYDSTYWIMGYKVENLWNKTDRQSHFRSAKAAFAALIDKISVKGTWERNPYVFAYTFELLK